MRNLLWRRAPLHWQLQSGLTLEVANEAEWTVYGGVFVDGEYDVAIARALARVKADETLSVVDLGANVGFFTLRLVDTIVRERGRDFAFRATLVEGSPACHAELTRRLSADPLLRQRVRVAHGLVGRRAGSATMFEHAFHAANSVNNPVLQREGRGTRVSFVDIMALTRDMPRIHLLKCDVEGSELMFLESYPDLLAKVDAAVMELHPGLCDVERCRRLLADAGLSHNTTIRAAADQSVEYFERH